MQFDVYAAYSDHVKFLDADARELSIYKSPQDLGLLKDEFINMFDTSQYVSQSFTH